MQCLVLEEAAMLSVTSESSVNELSRCLRVTDYTVKRSASNSIVATQGSLFADSTILSTPVLWWQN